VNQATSPLDECAVKPSDPDTWDAFARMAERQGPAGPMIRILELSHVKH
jgi:hypothetical protein